MSSVTESKNLNVILDVKVDLTVRIGSCMLPMRDVVELGEGTVLQLDQLASEPVGLYVNDKLIARGEVIPASSDGDLLDEMPRDYGVDVSAELRRMRTEER